MTASLTGLSLLELDANVCAGDAGIAEPGKCRDAAILADKQVRRPPSAQTLVLHGATAAIASVGRGLHVVSPVSDVENIDDCA